MKKFLALLTALLTVCAPLAACKGDNAPSESSADENTEASEASAEEEFYLDGKKLIVFGDSITALGTWGRTSAEKLNTYYFNGAMGGITSAQGIDRFPVYVAAQNPDIVTILFGMNDLIMEAPNKPRVSPEKFEENLKTLVKMTRDCGAKPVLLTTNPLDPNRFYSAQGQDKSWYSSVGEPLEWLDVYNDVTRKVAKEEGVLLVDMRAACEGVAYTALLTDGIHLAPKGNQIFVDTLVSALEAEYGHKEGAEKVSLETDYVKAEDSSEPISIIPFETDKWFTVTKSEMNFISDGKSLKISNTNGKWPEAHAIPPENINVSVETGVLEYNISLSGAGAAIVLFFDGATPSAFTEGRYLNINSYLGNTESYSGDLLPQQSLKGEIKLSDMAIPAASIKDGRVTITGIKIFVAGTAYSPVTIKELAIASR